MRSRKIILSTFAALILSVSLIGSVAEARPARRGIQQKQRVGILARLIELERRKNAWLRRTFLNK